eukprot:TRINITY_DN13456_c0_g1_i1.p1 TRINITY_DN13456_c0_g1~~TRINITY_DN13456_c0_g1_i1.p1  ORF type:complete len:1778 (-),score=364.93 TRINITY_DN13456_c0_g1_i1:25-5358(-)
MGQLQLTFEADFGNDAASPSMLHGNDTEGLAPIAGGDVGRLRVFGIEAALDPSVGRVEPFVALGVRSEVFRTTAHSPSLRPTWNEDFIFHPPIRSLSGDGDTLLCFDDLRLEVWDKHIEGKDKLGKATLMLCDLELGVVHDVTLHLKKRERRAGYIKLRLQAIDFGLQPSSVPAPITSSNRGNLAVRVLRATRLQTPSGETAAYESYIILRVGPQEKRTSIKQGTAAPEWHEHFLFEVGLNNTRQPTESLAVELLDIWDSLGEAEVDLGSLTQSQHDFFTVNTCKDGRLTGQVQIRLEALNFGVSTASALPPTAQHSFRDFEESPTVTPMSQAPLLPSVPATPAVAQPVTRQQPAMSTIVPPHFFDDPDSAAVRIQSHVRRHLAKKERLSREEQRRSRETSPTKEQDPQNDALLRELAVTRQTLDLTRAESAAWETALESERARLKQLEITALQSTEAAKFFQQQAEERNWDSQERIRALEQRCRELENDVSSKSDYSQKQNTLAVREESRRKEAEARLADTQSMLSRQKEENDALRREISALSHRRDIAARDEESTSKKIIELQSSLARSQKDLQDERRRAEEAMGAVNAAERRARDLEFTVQNSARTVEEEAIREQGHRREMAMRLESSEAERASLLLKLQALQTQAESLQALLQERENEKNAERAREETRRRETESKLMQLETEKEVSLRQAEKLRKDGETLSQKLREAEEERNAAARREDRLRKEYELQLTNLQRETDSDGSARIAEGRLKVQLAEMQEQYANAARQADLQKRELSQALQRERERAAQLEEEGKTEERRRREFEAAAIDEADRTASRLRATDLQIRELDSVLQKERERVVQLDDSLRREERKRRELESAIEELNDNYSMRNRYWDSQRKDIESVLQRERERCALLEDSLRKEERRRRELELSLKQAEEHRSQLEAREPAFRETEQLLQREREKNSATMDRLLREERRRKELESSATISDDLLSRLQAKEAALTDMEQTLQREQQRCAELEDAVQREERMRRTVEQQLHSTERTLEEARASVQLQLGNLRSSESRRKEVEARLAEEQEARLLLERQASTMRRELETALRVERDRAEELQASVATEERRRRELELERSSDTLTLPLRQLEESLKLEKHKNAEAADLLKREERRRREVEQHLEQLAERAVRELDQTKQELEFLVQTERERCQEQEDIAAREEKRRKAVEDLLAKAEDRAAQSLRANEKERRELEILVSRERERTQVAEETLRKEESRRKSAEAQIRALEDERAIITRSNEKGKRDLERELLRERERVEELEESLKTVDRRKRDLELEISQSEEDRLSHVSHIQKEFEQILQRERSKLADLSETLRREERRRRELEAIQLRQNEERARLSVTPDIKRELELNLQIMKEKNAELEEQFLQEQNRRRALEGQVSELEDQYAAVRGVEQSRSRNLEITVARLKERLGEQEEAVRREERRRREAENKLQLAEQEKTEILQIEGSKVSAQRQLQEEKVALLEEAAKSEEQRRKDLQTKIGRIEAEKTAEIKNLSAELKEMARLLQAERDARSVAQEALTEERSKRQMTESRVDVKEREINQLKRTIQSQNSGNSQRTFDSSAAPHQGQPGHPNSPTWESNRPGSPSARFGPQHTQIAQQQVGSVWPQWVTPVSARRTGSPAPFPSGEYTPVQERFPSPTSDASYLRRQYKERTEPEAYWAPSRGGSDQDWGYSTHDTDDLRSTLELESEAPPFRSRPGSPPAYPIDPMPWTQLPETSRQSVYYSFQRRSPSPTDGTWNHNRL